MCQVQEKPDADQPRLSSRCCSQPGKDSAKTQSHLSMASPRESHKLSSLSFLNCKWDANTPNSLGYCEK